MGITYISREIQAETNVCFAEARPDASIDSGFVASTFPAWDQCRDIITNDFTGVLTGHIAANAALTKMTQNCNSALAQG